MVICLSLSVCIRLFDGLVDCAIYFNSGSSAPLLTLPIRQIDS